MKSKEAAVKTLQKNHGTCRVVKGLQSSAKDNLRDIHLGVLFSFLSAMAFSQGADDVVPLLVSELKDNFQARVVQNDLDQQASYEFTALKDNALKEGEVTVARLKIKSKEVSTYNSMPLHERISELVPFLKAAKYRFLNVSHDTTLLTFENYFGSEQKNFLEIYLPPSADEHLEVIHLQEYLFRYPDEFDEIRYFDQSLYVGLKGCEAKCLISGDYLNRFQVFNEVDGSANVEETVETTMMTIPAHTKWVKKKADRNCHSSDPNDCLVWCLVEVPEKYETVQVLVDGSLNRNFSKRVIKTQIKVSDGGFSEYRKVLCEEDITEEIADAIRNALNVRGYEAGSENGIIDADLKAALVTFQREMQLPIGQLDFETLSRL